MKVLVIGGTQFVGRAFVEEATRRGHDVTIFHRGSTEPTDLPAVEHVHGDRSGDLAVLADGSWDAAVDSSAYLPRAVRELADAIADSVRHYTLVSTISVYPLDTAPGSTEESPLRAPVTDTENITGETYGGLKVACEAEARTAFERRTLVVRPGYVVGPHDPTDRFTSYVRRAAGGGEMLAPGPPDAPFQVVDARDLAAFIADRVEAADADTYCVAGPAEPLTFGDALETAVAVGGNDVELTWVSADFLRERLGEGRWPALPMWHPEFPGMSTFDAGKARGAGLRFRPLADTIADILAWDRDRGTPPLHVGLRAEKERELLEAWRRRP